MAVIGSTIDEIASQKIKPITGGLKIENTPEITDVKATKIVASFAGNAKVPGIIASYVFTSSYQNNSNEKVAEIKIKGKILYATKDEKEAEELEKEFKKSKRLKANAEIELLNHVLQKATLNALTISQMLELPPVIKLPRIVRREKA